VTPEEIEQAYANGTSPAEVRIAELERELAAERDKVKIAPASITKFDAGRFERERDEAEDRERNALKRAEAAEARAAAAVEVLRSVEWRGRYHDDRCCPCCDGDGPSDFPTAFAGEHVAGCALAAVLAGAPIGNNPPADCQPDWQARAAALAAGLEEALGCLEKYAAPEHRTAQRRAAIDRGRALLAAGPSEAAAELAGLRAEFAELAALQAFMAHLRCGGSPWCEHEEDFKECPNFATKGSVARYDCMPLRVWCDEHGGDDETEEFQWAASVRGEK
jgi:hypothetical protein